MFPIPWNKAYRKKDGTLVNIDEAINGGGSSDIPEYSAEDAGKVLAVTEEGTLAWVTVSGGSNFGKAVCSGEIINPDISVKGGA